MTTILSKFVKKVYKVDMTQANVSRPDHFRFRTVILQLIMTYVTVEFVVI